MISNVIKTEQIPSGSSLILLTTDNSEYNKFFTIEEQQYIEKRKEQKKNIIPINKYQRLIILVHIERKKENHLNLEELRNHANKVYNILFDHKYKESTIIGSALLKDEELAFLEGFILSSYSFTKYLNKSEEKANCIEKVLVYSQQVTNQDISNLLSITKAVAIARDLINEPVNFLNAVRLAEIIALIGKESGFQVETFNKEKITSLGMGGLLAVNQGSIDPPTFSILTWKPANVKNAKPIVLVGKGIVFDTGGLSLKPTANSMDEMKCDMSGAAAVASVFFAISRLQLPLYVIGLIPATDNRPDGNAYTPGDIIKMYDGTTVEVLNTDAEGRMILADALSYAKQYNPELLIDIATLTGSAAVAIGKYGVVAMGNTEKTIMQKLMQSGNQVFERIVEFPFWDDYKELIKSDIADLKNIGGKDAGAITAGKFLEHFTDYPYIHLDIAGPAFVKDNYSYRGKGGTGIGVRLLVDFLKNI